MTALEDESKALEDESSETSDLDTSTQAEDQQSAESSSYIPGHQQRRSRRGRSTASADRRHSRRCRSLSSDHGDAQGYSPTRAADDMDSIDGVQPLAEAGAADNGINGFCGHSSLSLSVDSVSSSASNHKRKAVATLPGNEQKSHRKSL